MSYCVNPAARKKDAGGTSGSRGKVPKIIKDRDRDCGHRENALHTAWGTQGRIKSNKSRRIRCCQGISLASVERTRQGARRAIQREIFPPTPVLLLCSEVTSKEGRGEPMEEVTGGLRTTLTNTRSKKRY